MANTFENLFTNIKREKLLALSNISIMTVTFVLLGILIYVVTLSQTALRYLERQAQVTVFFEDTLSEGEILTLRDSLLGDARILDVTYVSKIDALNIFREMNKDEPILLESISADILPASLEVKTIQVADLSVLAEELSAREGVEDVRFYETVVSKLLFWSNLIYIVGTVLVGLFLVISYSVVLVTLRTTINSKGVELEIMKLVGASDSYVKKPLLYEGVFFGLVSALFSGIVMLVIGFFMNRWGVLSGGLSFFFLPQTSVNPFAFSGMIFGLLIFSGGLLGYLGSFTAVKRYLKY
jgi:cell division transport system permease protein